MHVSCRQQCYQIGFQRCYRLGMLAGRKVTRQMLIEGMGDLRRFPDQETFLSMVRGAGFGNASYRNLSLGVACLHSAWKI